MTVPGGDGPGAILPPAPTHPAGIAHPVPLRSGQSVFFRVLPPGKEGELRVRINGQDFAASARKPLEPGSTGKAVVEAQGPPLRIRITDLSLPASTPVSPRIPVLLGREPLRANVPPAALEQFNSRLAAVVESGQAPPTQFLREAIVLSRFLASTIVRLPGFKATVTRPADPPPNASPPVSGNRESPAGTATSTQSALPETAVAEPAVAQTAPAPAPPVLPAGIRGAAVRDAPEEIAGASRREPIAPLSAPPGVEPTEAPRFELSNASRQGMGAPFWFFVPFPGEKAPLLFPGYRDPGQGGSEASWRLFFRLPDIGAVSIRFQPSGVGWSIVFDVEHEGLCRQLEAGVPDLSETLRDRGFPLRDVLVRPGRRGTAESEFGAMLSRDTGIQLLEERA